MLSETAMKNRAYRQVRDPHAGEKINSEEDLIIRVISILEAHPEGLTPRALISRLIPYEG